jgi:RNA polymerase-binding transcription factor
MTKAEIKTFTRVLEAKRAELSQSLRNRDSILIEKSPDALDEVQNATERELAIRNLHEDFNLLRKVRAALSRVDEGTYGVCQHCEGDISPKRLNAVPWVPYCIRCQEITDRNQEAGQETVDGLLVSVS